MQTWISAGLLVVALASLVFTWRARRDAKDDAAAAKADAAKARQLVEQANASAARSAAASERVASAQEVLRQLAEDKVDTRPWLIDHGAGPILFRLTNNTAHPAFEVQLLPSGPVHDMQAWPKVPGRGVVEFAARLATSGGLRSEPFTVLWRTEEAGTVHRQDDLMLPPATDVSASVW